MIISYQDKEREKKARSGRMSRRKVTLGYMARAAIAWPFSPLNGGWENHPAHVGRAL
jgi:hypothetical protein